MGLSPYELQRERNIAANHERLTELGLTSGLTPKRRKAEPKKRQRTPGDQEWKPERTTRVSGRTTAAPKPKAGDSDEEDDYGDSDEEDDYGDSDEEDDYKTLPKPKKVKSEAKFVAKPEPTDQTQSITIEAAKTGRSKCRQCMEQLAQGEMRVGMESWMVGRAVVVWQHLRCFADNVVVTTEVTGRSKCKQTKARFSVGEARLSCTAHTTTSHFKPVAVAKQLQVVFALAKRNVESIDGFEQLLAEDTRSLRNSAAAAAVPRETKPEVDETPSQAKSLDDGAAQPAKGSVSRAQGKVCWRFAGHLCYGMLLPSQENRTHCYARTHKGNTKTLTKGTVSWWILKR